MVTGRSGRRNGIVGRSMNRSPVSSNSSARRPSSPGLAVCSWIRSVSTWRSRSASRPPSASSATTSARLTATSRRNPSCAFDRADLVDHRPRALAEDVHHAAQRRPVTASLEPAAGEVLRERPDVDAGRLLEVVEDRLAQAERDSSSASSGSSPRTIGLRVSPRSRATCRNRWRRCHHATAPFVRTICVELGVAGGASITIVVTLSPPPPRSASSIRSRATCSGASPEPRMYWIALGRGVAVEPVRAQQQPIARLELELDHIDPGLRARAEVARQHVLVRMALRLVGGQQRRGRPAPRRSCDRA